MFSGVPVPDAGSAWLAFLHEHIAIRGPAETGQRSDTEASICPRAVLAGTAPTRNRHGRRRDLSGARRDRGHVLPMAQAVRALDAGSVHSQMPSELPVRVSRSCQECLNVAQLLPESRKPFRRLSYLSPASASPVTATGIASPIQTSLIRMLIFAQIGNVLAI